MVLVASWPPLRRQSSLEQLPQTSEENLPDRKVTVWTVEAGSGALERTITLSRGTVGALAQLASLPRQDPSPSSSAWPLPS